MIRRGNTAVIIYIKIRLAYLSNNLLVTVFYIWTVNKEEMEIKENIVDLKIG